MWMNHVFTCHLRSTARDSPTGPSMVIITSPLKVISGVAGASHRRPKGTKSTENLRDTNVAVCVGISIGSSGDEIHKAVGDPHPPETRSTPFCCLGPPVTAIPSGACTADKAWKEMCSDGETKAGGRPARRMPTRRRGTSGTYGTGCRRDAASQCRCATTIGWRMDSGGSLALPLVALGGAMGGLARTLPHSNPGQC